MKKKMNQQSKVTKLSERKQISNVYKRMGFQPVAQFFMMV